MNINRDFALFRTALLNKDVAFMYQPIVKSNTGIVEYYECLMRLLDKQYNWLTVGDMIIEAEKRDLIYDIDSMVIEMAISYLVTKKHTLSVNISSIGAGHIHLLRKIESLLQKNNVARRLIIEITETALNQDLNAIKNFIDTLRAYGCRIALDDFGSGFTSFMQLSSLKFDIVKIDGSYIKNILYSDNNQAFVQSVIHFAQHMNIKTVAECVENSDTASFLRNYQIDYMQGNFFLPASKRTITL